MFLKCNRCGNNKLFAFSWLAGENSCGDCLNKDIFRKKNGLCLFCGNGEKVWFSGTCENCRLHTKRVLREQANLLEGHKIIEKLDEDRKRDGGNNDLKNIWEWVKLFFQIGVAVFIFWISAVWLFGDNNNTENIIRVDCTRSNSEYNKFCNGEYEASIQAENLSDETYYGNIRGR